MRCSWGAGLKFMLAVSSCKNIWINPSALHPFIFLCAYWLAFLLYFYCPGAVTGLTSVSVYHWAISEALVTPCSETEELFLQRCYSPDYQSAPVLSWLGNYLFGMSHASYKSFGKLCVFLYLAERWVTWGFSCTNGWRPLWHTAGKCCPICLLKADFPKFAHSPFVLLWAPRVRH